jgi:hypothetical protein
MKQRRTITTLTAGVIVGATLTGPVATAAENWLRATPSAQQFFVDGQRVELEAYAINGNNYVKLRDIGKAVDFNVSYEPMFNSVIVISGAHYEDEGQTSTVVEIHTPDTGNDYSDQANPAIFGGAYTREMYNAMRYAVTHPDEITNGTYQPNSMGEVDISTTLRLTSKLSGGSTHYSLTETFDSKDQYLKAEHLERYDAAIAHIQPFIQEISSLPQQEQIREMVWYIADRMTYSTKVRATPDKILAQDEVMLEAGSYMTYSTCLSFFCEQAGIPCILIDSYDHQWNMVYVDGQWWQVDPTGPNDNIYTLHFQEYSNGAWREVEKSEAERRIILEDYRTTATILQKDMGDSPSYVDEHPEMTRFLQELLMPGSTLKN